MNSNKKSTRKPRKQTTKQQPKQQSSQMRQQQYRRRRMSSQAETGAVYRDRRLKQMILDPCNADLEPGLHGTAEGVLQRFVTNFAPVSTATYGYFVWFPSFHTGATNDYNNGQARYFNNFLWNDSANTGNSVPANTTAAPFGSGGAGTANSFADPFFSTLSSTNVQDGRTLSACVKIRPTGAISAIQGTISFLDNIPYDLFESQTTGTSAPAPTVNQMLAYSRKIERLGIDSYEVKHRPSQSDKFYTEVESPFAYPYVGAATAGPTYTTAIANSTSPRGIGFAWTNTGGSNTFLFSLYKNVEWRPSPLSGVPVPRPISVHTNRIETILADLDSVQEWMFSVASNPTAHKLINTVYTMGGQIFNQQKSGSKFLLRN